MARKIIDYKNITLEELAAVVSDHLKKHKIDCVLVGGGCVSIYSHNCYQSYDLDYVTYEDMKNVSLALKELGFKRKGRYFNHPKCLFFIEFVSPPVAVGNEPIDQFYEKKTVLGVIKMLTPTDCVKDRLASFYHWNDKQALDQALLVCKDNLKQIDIKEIKRWSKQEGNLNNFEIFMQKFQQLNK
jgi:hypothetical protein